MPSIATKNSSGTFVGEGEFPQAGHSGGGTVEIGGETQEQLRLLAREVISGISEMDASHSEELLDAFVLELLLIGKEQERREERRRKQAEGIAAAKAKGVHFGRQPQALPDGFEELRQAWRNKKVSLKVAAEACGIPKSTFYSAALRVEMAAQEHMAREQERREERRRRQAEGIAAAKAKGVHFGPQPQALPDDFEELRQSWRKGEISLRLAAEACGIPKSTFYSAAVRVETAAKES